MSCKSRIVKWQKTREIITKKKYNGESSPYWQYINNNNKSNPQREGGQEQSEYPTANSDVLAEGDSSEENLTRKIILRDWRQIKFSKQEKGVLQLLAKNLKQEDIAKALKTTRASVAQAIIRIQKKGTARYTNKVANGSIYSTEEESE